MPKFLKIMTFSAKDAERQFSFNRFESDSGEGYQRQPQPGRIKEMAAFAETHKRWVFPVINAVLNDDLTLEILDGQNRALAGMLAGVDIPVAVGNARGRKSRIFRTLERRRQNPQNPTSLPSATPGRSWPPPSHSPASPCTAPPAGLSTP